MEADKDKPNKTELDPHSLTRQIKDISIFKQNPDQEFELDGGGSVRLEERIAAGGMGTVYLSTYKTPKGEEIKAATKTLRIDFTEDSRERFRREKETLESLKEVPNISKFIAAGTDPKTQTHFIVMEYIEGKTLDDIVKNPSQKTSNESLSKWIKQMLETLIYFHSKGFVNRDIKPPNIMIDVNEDAKMIDMGIAKDTKGKQETMTHEGISIGTPVFMSPEQLSEIKNTITPKSDIYSLGATFYYVLTRKFASGANANEIMINVFNEPKWPNQEIREENRFRNKKKLFEQKLFSIFPPIKSKSRAEIKEYLEQRLEAVTAAKDPSDKNLTYAFPFLSRRSKQERKSFLRQAQEIIEQYEVLLPKDGENLNPKPLICSEALEDFIMMLMDPGDFNPEIVRDYKIANSKKDKRKKLELAQKAVKNRPDASEALKFIEYAERLGLINEPAQEGTKLHQDKIERYEKQIKDSANQENHNDMYYLNRTIALYKPRYSPTLRTRKYHLEQAMHHLQQLPKTNETTIKINWLKKLKAFEERRENHFGLTNPLVLLTEEINEKIKTDIQQTIPTEVLYDWVFQEVQEKFGKNQISETQANEFYESLSLSDFVTKYQKTIPQRERRKKLAKYMGIGAAALAAILSLGLGANYLWSKHKINSYCQQLKSELEITSTESGLEDLVERAEQLPEDPKFELFRREITEKLGKVRTELTNQENYTKAQEELDKITELLDQRKYNSVPKLIEGIREIIYTLPNSREVAELKEDLKELENIYTSETTAIDSFEKIKTERIPEIEKRLQEYRTLVEQPPFFKREELLKLGEQIRLIREQIKETNKFIIGDEYETVLGTLNNSQNRTSELAEELANNQAKYLTERLQSIESILDELREDYTVDRSYEQAEQAAVLLEEIGQILPNIDPELIPISEFTEKSQKSKQIYDLLRSQIDNLESVKKQLSETEDENTKTELLEELITLYLNNRNLVKAAEYRIQLPEENSFVEIIDLIGEPQIRITPAGLKQEHITEYQQALQACIELGNGNKSRLENAVNSLLEKTKLEDPVSLRELLDNYSLLFKEKSNLEEYIKSAPSSYTSQITQTEQAVQEQETEFKKHLQPIYESIEDRLDKRIRESAKTRLENARLVLKRYSRSRIEYIREALNIINRYKLASADIQSAFSSLTEIENLTGKYEGLEQKQEELTKTKKELIQIKNDLKAKEKPIYQNSAEFESEAIRIFEERSQMHYPAETYLRLGELYTQLYKAKKEKEDFRTKAETYYKSFLDHPERDKTKDTTVQSVLEELK